MSTLLRSLPQPARDALLDVSAQAAAQAARALAMMMGISPADWSSDPLRFSAAGDVAKLLGAEPWLAADFALRGGVPGRLVLGGQLKHLLWVSARLNGAPGPVAPHLDALAEGTLAEAGNVVASSFLNVFANRLKTVCTPSVPSLHPWTAAELPAAEAAVASWHVATQASWQVLLVWWPDPAQLSALGDALLPGGPVARS